MAAANCAHSQVWLTYVLNDLDVPKALTLYFSMKRVFTSRKLAVFVSHNVSVSKREVLHQVFDFFFYLEKERNTAGLKDEEFVKLSTFSLKCFEKVVFLEPTILAVKNSDDIFDNCEVPSGLVVTEVGQGEDEYDGLSVFVARPNLQVFNTLMTALQTRNGTGFETYLRIWSRNQMEKGDNYLEEKYNQKILLTTFSLVGYESDFSLVNLVDIPMGVCKKNYGVSTQLILAHRQRIYDEDVQQLLKTMINGTPSRKLDELFVQPTCPKEPIAIVGMSCRYPSANNLQEFWSRWPFGSLTFPRACLVLSCIAKKNL